jgi:ribonuclease III
MLPTFHDPVLIKRALTHRSYLNEHTDAVDEQDNERLEFLGDAVLDFITGAWLFERFPELDEGKLTTLRAALVRVTTLAEFARELGLPEQMRLGKGEVDTGGRNRANIIGDAFEAVLGALYLDQGIEACRVFVLPFLEQATPRILHGNADRDPKSKLQEWSQGALNITPKYKMQGTHGPDHAKVFTVEVWLGDSAFASGTGTSKQQAEQIAAREALVRAHREFGSVVPPIPAVADDT